MAPEFTGGNVRTNCPDCRSITTFESQSGGQHFGSVVIEGQHGYNGRGYARTIFLLLRCAGCHRGGLAKVHALNTVREGVMETFEPISIDTVSIPPGTPDGIAKEFREAEKCAAFAAWRAASALLRSTLEKTLKANGYASGSLRDKIDEAAADGIITDARRKRAHDDIRVLGNDVMHDDWREISEAEVQSAHQYAQRVLEDFYDDRPSVEAILIAKRRVQAQ